MKTSKKWLLLLLVSVIVLVLVVLVIRITTVISQHYHYMEYRPSSQENTMWQSEDGTILLYIDEGNNGRVYFKESDFLVQYYYVSDRGYFADVYSWDAVENERLGLYPEEHYETWDYLKVKENTFTITVEKTTFLTVGDIITFYKILPSTE